jgi:hypothetical protein
MEEKRGKRRKEAVNRPENAASTEIIRKERGNKSEVFQWMQMDNLLI